MKCFFKVFPDSKINDSKKVVCGDGAASKMAAGELPTFIGTFDILTPGWLLNGQRIFREPPFFDVDFSFLVCHSL